MNDYGNAMAQAAQRQGTTGGLGDQAHAPTLPPPPVVSGHRLTGEAGPLFAALAKAQAAFGDIKRTRTVKVTPRDSAAYTFNYAPLDEVLAAVSVALNANAIVLLQPLYEDADGWHLRTVLGHSSGATIECSASIPWPERKWWDKNASEYKSAKGSWQDFGSAVTYARRYMVGSLLGVAPEEDDDGNAAAGNEREASDRTGPRANTQATPPAKPRQPAQEKPAPEQGPKVAPAAETKPAPTETAPRPQSQPPPKQAELPVAAPDLGTTLAKEEARTAELSPNLAAPTEAQNVQVAELFKVKVWPRLDAEGAIVPTAFADLPTRRAWLKEKLGISDPKNQLTTMSAMANVIAALEKLPNRAAP